MSQEHFYRKRCKRLGYALGLSCFLNISLLSFGLYEWQEAGFSYLATSAFYPQKSKVYRQNGKQLATLTKSLRDLEGKSFDELVALLDDETLASDGYKVQDLALSILGFSHHVDIERALSGQVLTKRLFSYTTHSIILYPDLSQTQREDVRRFLQNERYPFTLEGLLAKYKQEQDPLLKETIAATNKYRCIELLLKRGTTCTSDAIFELVANCDYSLVNEFYDEMVKAQDFSGDVRRGFLYKALPHSAELLFKTEPRFCVHTLQDAEAEALLSTLGKNPEANKEYALALLEAPRSKAIWQKAQAVLRTEANPDETRLAILERYGRVKPQPIVAKQAAIKPKPTATPKPLQPPKEIIYTVQAGDTLWHLSKRFGVDIQTLKKYNKLSSDALKPGSKLRIPQQPTKPSQNNKK